MKITLSKAQWQLIGKQTGWIKTSETTKTYKDKNNTGRTITLSGPDTINPNFIYDATIRDEFGTVESAFEGTLGEIYLGAKEREFLMPESVKELQAKNSNVIKTAGSQDIANALKIKHPIIYNFISRMPGFNSALDIVDNIKNNKVAPEKAGINQDMINQANQIINKVKPTTASNKIILKEALTLDVRVIATIILIILGFLGAKSLIKDAPQIQGVTQAEQFQQQMSK